MIRRTWVVVVLVLVRAASGQWLEATIPVGDSPMSICGNERFDKVYAANFAGSSVTVIDAATNSVMGTVANIQSPRRLVYHPSTAKVYCSSFDEPNVVVIDGFGDSVLARVPVYAPWGALCPAVGPKRVYAVGTGNSLWAIDSPTDSIVAEIAVGDANDGLCCDETDGCIFCSLGDSSVAVVSIAGDSVVETRPIAQTARVLTWSATGNRVYCGGPGDTVTVLGGAGGLPVNVAAGPVTDFCLNEHEQKVYVVGRTNPFVVVLDQQSDTVLTTIPTCAGPYSLCLDASANKLYVVCFDSDSVLVVDCGRDEIIARIAVGDGPLHAAQSPAQRRVFVTDSYSNTVSVIRDTTTAAVADEPGHERKGLPAVVRATLRPSGASAEILDVAGRRVLELQIGDDDMSRVRPGVYFVRQDDGSATAKILVAR